MLQINNMDDGRAEWNINETHILIPMIDGDVTNKESDKILGSTLTLNSLEGGDQAILTNALEHSLVIGLDKNIFEAPNYKSDLVIIQNSDLKLFSCNSDLKNSVAYTLSYVDQDKSEILWQSPVLKDKVCTSDKAILEVRDVLNYDDSVHELEKSEQNINLDSMDTDIRQVIKDDKEILTEDAVCETKEESQSFNCYSSSQCNKSDPVLTHLNASKFTGSVPSIESKNSSENESNTVNSAYKLGKEIKNNILNTAEPVKEINESVQMKLVEFIKHKTERKGKIFTNKDKDTKDKKVERKMEEGIHDFLPEKSLPLKKKAKMKRTLISYGSENQTTLLKQDGVDTNHVFIKYPTQRKIKRPLATTNFKDESHCTSTSNKSLIKKVRRIKKTTKLKTNLKIQKSVSAVLVKEDGLESKIIADNLNKENPTTKANFCQFDITKFNDVYGLVEGLRKCGLINATIWQTLNSGLKEMKVDILKEMNARINEKYSPNRTYYSPQLKAFALVLYFKQPAAFNHLSQVYKTGWPSLNVIKEWKRRMNSHQRPNFIRTETPKTSPK